MDRVKHQCRSCAYCGEDATWCALPGHRVQISIRMWACESWQKRKRLAPGWPAFHQYARDYAKGQQHEGTVPDAN